MASGEAEGRGVFERMNRVSRTFLGKTLEYGGVVPLDPVVREAVQHRVPFTLFAPAGPATREVDRMARRLAGLQPAAPSGTGFFSRLGAWLSPPGKFA